MINRTQLYCCSRLLVCIFIVSCSAESAQLSILKQTNVASYTLSSAETRASSFNESKKNLGKTFPAEYRAEFVPKPNFTSQEAFREVISAFEKDGWDADEVSENSAKYRRMSRSQGEYLFHSEILLKTADEVIVVIVQAFKR